MKTVVITSLGDPEALQIQEVEDPKIKDDEVLIKVEAAALSRGDIYQRQGFYPPPQGASPYPGLECSGCQASLNPLEKMFLAGKQEIRSMGAPVELVHLPFRLQSSKEQRFLTAGNEQKLAFCKDLGADVCINYKTEDFVARVKEESGGKGVDVFLDSVGAAYFQQNLDSLNIDGKLFIIGSLNGFVAEVNIGAMFANLLGNFGLTNH
ncbi:hypothetical protein CRYUN_Cryun07bG0181600 [Craigia yunnanensis]